MSDELCCSHSHSECEDVGLFQCLPLLGLPVGSV